MSDHTIPLFIFTGFLGSGKTSVINHLLEQFPKARIALVINDFGQICVDQALIQTGPGEITVKILTNGQIFCNCMSGSFIDAVVDCASYRPDMILVEASGLAKPAPMLEIVSFIQQRTHGLVNYGGMVCVIDAECFTSLSQVLLTVEEQAVFSDLFILNKTDLTDEETLIGIEHRLGSLRPLAPIIRTTQGKVSKDVLLALSADLADRPHTGSRYNGWGLQGRPKNCVFLPELPYGETQLRFFLGQVSPSFFRIKGFVPSQDGLWCVSTVGNQISVTNHEVSNGIPLGLVCIHSPGIDGPSLLRTNWQSEVGTSCNLTVSPR